MTTQLLWGTRQPAVALTDQEHHLKKMYHVRFSNGGIDSSNSGPDGDAETDGMFLYVVCKTLLSDESISITYIGTDDVSYTIPVSGGLNLTLKQKGDIVRITNAVDLQTVNSVKAKEVVSVQRTAGGIAGQELEIWGIDSDVPFMSLKQPPPFEPEFEEFAKVNTLITGDDESKSLGFKLNAVLSYERLTTEEARPFVDIRNFRKHFYLYPHFLEAPGIKFKVRWANVFKFDHWHSKRRFYAVPEINFKGIEILESLPKPLDPPSEHTGYWSSPYARIDNDDARFWDGEEPWMKEDLIFNVKKAFGVQYSGAQATCPLVVSKTHLETHPGESMDINLNLSRQHGNLLADGNMEFPDTSKYSVGGTGTITKDKSNIRFGRQSLKFVGIASQDNFKQEITLQGGYDYHYELWVYKSSSTTNFVSTEGWNNTDGAWLFANIDAPGTNGWYKITIDFEVGGSGTKIVWIQFRQVGAGYTLYWFKNLWLKLNKVNNPGFEGTYSGGVAPGWTKNGSPTCQASTDKHTGTYAQAITNSASSANSVSQQITGLTVGDWKTLKIFLKKSSGTGNVIAELSGAGSKVLQTNASLYTELTYTFKTSATTAIITLYCDNAGVVGLFDDCSITDACPETIGELLSIIDGLADYSATAQANETDFDGTTEKHYNADAGADNLIPMASSDIKASAVTINW